MVNNANVSAYQGLVPASNSSDAARRISGGPLYDSNDVFKILRQGDGSTIPWTNKCTRDIHRLELDIADVRKLIKETLEKGRYKNSQWCEQAPSGPWAACDAYSLKRKEWVENAKKEMEFEYYVKFAIGKTGKILLLVSCHEPQDRG